MPRIVDHEQRRAEIVRALWQVIATSGVEGVSLLKVAQAAGVSIGRIQHYFDSREVLVLAGVERLIVAANVAYDATAEASPRDRLLHVLVQQVPRSQLGRVGVTVWYAYLASAISDLRIREVLAEALLGAETECAAHVAALHAIDESQAQAVARRLLALSDGLTLRVLVDRLDPDEAIAILRAEVDAGR